MNKFKEAEEEFKRIVTECTEERVITELNENMLGSRLRKIREDSGMSLREMARRLSCSAPYLSDVENGKRGIRDRLGCLYVLECQKEKEYEEGADKKELG